MFETIELITIVGILFLLVVVFRSQKRKKTTSTFEEIKKRVELDLAQAKFSNNWKERQKLNLQLLWLNSVKDVNLKNVTNRVTKGRSSNEILDAITEDELRFPMKWDLNSIYHYPFIHGIISKFGESLGDKGYKGLYKPNNALPFPKTEIIKAFHYAYDFLNMENPPYPIEDKEAFIDNMDIIKISLYMNYVETKNSELPDEGVQNILIGQKLLKEAESLNEVDEFNLLDWRSEELWLNSSIQYMNEDEYDVAEKCLNKAKNLNPISKNVKNHFGLFYLLKAEYYEGEENVEKGKEFRELANEYGINDKTVKEKFNFI